MHAIHVLYAINMDVIKANIQVITIIPINNERSVKMSTVVTLSFLGLPNKAAKIKNNIGISTIRKINKPGQDVMDFHSSNGICSSLQAIFNKIQYMIFILSLPP
ncbi:MAG: hypothetical protein GTO23_02085 [Nitrososphaeria archaeon]|nr:hypothetical protein [Nitrososphaeria archaeon]